MSNQTNGLRFDVYERVHLPEDMVAIQELEEIELVPRIQIVQQDEQVLLKGHLLLTGVYRGNNEAASEQALEHWIPVEITLPMNRVQRLDNISVEIDNFDVDLLSARTLNVTGVLSLLGIGFEQPVEQEQWPREEPFVVVHQRDEQERVQHSFEQAEVGEPFPLDQREDAQYFNTTEVSPYYQTFIDSLQREEAQREAAQREREATHREAHVQSQQQREYEALIAEAKWEAEQQEIVQQNSIAREAFLREEQLIAEARRQEVIQREAVPFEHEQARFEQEEINRQYQIEQLTKLVPNEMVPTEDSLQQRTEFVNGKQEVEIPSVEDGVKTSGKDDNLTTQNIDIREESAQPIQAAFSFDANLVNDNGELSSLEPEIERKEIRIGLGSKSPEAEKAVSKSGIGFQSILHSSRREQEAKAAAEQQAQKAAVEERKSTGDEIEWKNLFYGRSGDDESFRKLRLCIVQREETLESIAGRYQIQPREILLYNRLSDHSISEGQVLYIP